MSLNIILISIGVFQPYIINNIRQLIKLNYEKIFIITNNEFMHEFKDFSQIHLICAEDLDVNFDSKSKLDTSFRNGFWNNTSKRLFYLHECMKKFNLTNSIHIENDVLLYHKFLKTDFNFQMWITMDAENRCIPGIIYIPNYKFMDNLINNYDYYQNDMINMAIFYKKNQSICSTFPIMKKNTLYEKEDMYCEHFEKYKGIFDGAAIGQYLGGIDPRNQPGDTVGFINETCVVKYNNYKFTTKEVANNCKIPIIMIDSEEIPIFNLHIHSKNLHLFLL